MFAEVGITKDGQRVTLWAYEDFGDAPEELTPAQARAVAAALLKASFKAEMGAYAKDHLTAP